MIRFSDQIAAYEILREFVLISLLHFQIKEILPLQRKFADLKAELELKSYDLSLFQSRAEQCEHHKVYLYFTISLLFI